MKQFFLPILLLSLMSSGSMAQEYQDFLGAGHDFEVEVTTSSNDDADGYTSVDGFDVQNTAALKDASRFLAQATMGYDYEMIQMTAAMGFDAWIDEQFSLPRQSFASMDEALALAFDDEFVGMDNFRSAWWNYALSSADQLRQRLNYNLSELFVVSGFGSDFFEDYGILSSSYYDVLGDNAFANYRQLLSAVSRSPVMGIYLSHYNNPRSDPANNIHPDENYAREVMQLFSIGLFELNNDGTHQLDANGQPIPTYDNDDIREFARIFTGFADGRPDGSWDIPFDDNNDVGDIVSYPMAMYDEHH
ncbi:MAG: DUF1800 family protein, partial [Bacteroidota bacterium]